jgi:aminocarboxymuconate-semialdehyde decarboxylase
MPVVDVHNHYYPPGYIDELRRGRSNVKVTEDAEGNPLIHYPGDYNVAVRGHRDLAYRADVLERAGVDTEVVSLTTPGTHVETPARAVELARLVNDEFAEGVAEYKGRFAAYATLPLNDGEASARELDRAMRELKLPGAMLFGNVNGVPLNDDSFTPLYEAANDLDAILHIHPTFPVGVEAMQEYWLMPLCGFMFDTTLAAARIVFAGIPERFPRIKWALGHLGGTIPYIAERLDRGFAAFPECRAHIDRKPSEYLREFYLDTVNFDPSALRLAVDFAGADHLLAGSDYPHRICSIASMKASIAAIGLSEQDTAAILGGNATRLYGLDRKAQKPELQPA